MVYFMLILNGHTLVHHQMVLLSATAVDKVCAKSSAHFATKDKMAKDAAG